MNAVWILLAFAAAAIALGNAVERIGKASKADSALYDDATETDVQQAVDLANSWGPLDDLAARRAYREAQR
jgi:hypothetical protein